MSDEEWTGHENSLFYADDEGIEKLKRVIEKFCQDVCAQEAIPIKIDEYICEEVHSRAKKSIGYHSEKNYSIYKELSHIGYWINRLKPLRIDSPMNVFRVLGALTFALDEWMLGKWTQTIDRAKNEEERLGGKLDFPINEHVVVSMILDLIEASQQQHAKTFGKVVETDYLDAISDNRKRFVWLRHRLETSLRNHTHSARGFATLIEGSLRTRCEM